MKRLGLILILMMTVTLVSSNKIKQERPKDLIYSLDNLKQSVMELDSILKHGKLQ